MEEMEMNWVMQVEMEYDKHNSGIQFGIGNVCHIGGFEEIGVNDGSNSGNMEMVAMKIIIIIIIKMH